MVFSQSCYGVLHCSLGDDGATDPNSLEGLEDTSKAREGELTVPPKGKSYEAYDAIVVSEETKNGRSRSKPSLGWGIHIMHASCFFCGAAKIVNVALLFFRWGGWGGC